MYTEIKKIFPERNVTLTSYFIDNSGEFQQGFKRPMVIVCPGGGYSFLSDREADPIAMKYLAAGFHAAVLRYGINEYAVAPGPLKDIAAAVAYVKSLSDERFVDRDNVFVCGFSAGAHVAGQLGVFWNNNELLPEYDGRHEDIRPAGMILGYPVLDLHASCSRLDICAKPGQKPEDIEFGQKHPKMPLEEMFIFNEKENRYLVNFEKAMNAYIFDGEYTPEQEDFYSLQNQVNEDTAEAFIWHNGDDGLIFPSNSICFADAMQKAGRPYELHLFSGGGHGVSLGTHLTANDRYQYWPHCDKWMDLSIEWINTLSGYKNRILSRFMQELPE